MIYRAFDCGIFDNAVEPATTVWFSAHSRAEAGERLTALLALTWQVAAERICVGNVDDEVEMERDSLQGKAAGDRRWLESGSSGANPMYCNGPALIFLGARDRARLQKAAEQARLHVVDIASRLFNEWSAAKAEAGSDSRKAQDVRWNLDMYEAIARQVWLYEALA